MSYTLQFYFLKKGIRETVGADLENIEHRGANNMKYQTEPEGVPHYFLYDI